MQQKKTVVTPYLSGIGAWALAFGCAVGWGAFAMPGSTFLPVAGPVGTALGIALGAVAMLLLAANFHTLMNRFHSDGGGVYTYTKHIFGYDHGFVSAWFLLITYIAVIWANATALPLIMRRLMGGAFQYGFHYTVAGFDVWLGEILLSEAALALAALVCLRRRLAVRVQVVCCLALLGGVAAIFAVAVSRSGAAPIAPAYPTEGKAVTGIFTIFALSPWAFVGFESISHSAAEARFDLKRTFRILAVAVVTAAAAYILLTLLAVTALPEDCASWPEYIANLDAYSGTANMPTFFAAHAAMGDAGSVVLAIAAFCGMFTGLIGNTIVLSRLIHAMGDDNLVPAWLAETDRNCVPRNAVLGVMVVSAVLPLLGRTAISWIVDVTTVGAVICYAYASAGAARVARGEKNRRAAALGWAGLAISLLFALEFLIPNLSQVSTLSAESYFILAAWSILGMLHFRRVFRRDAERRFGRSVVVWAILLALIIFSSGVWMLQQTNKAIDNSIEPIQEYCVQRSEDASDGAEETESSYLAEVLGGVKRAQTLSGFLFIALVVVALAILFDIYRGIQKRQRDTEVEKALAEESSRAKTSFLSNMSHEIRTPMNAIIGLDNIALRNPNLQPQTREQLEKIGASAKHLLGLINDILDMSRIESGRIVIKREEFSFREFLDQINVIINGQCVDKGLHYECNIVGHVADYYVGDDLKLKQVLINILGNSVKFTDAPGDVTLTVEQVNAFEGMCTLRFTMQDTGIGMDKAFIPKLFDAFSQEDATTTNRYGGSGLGMAITKNFVEMMNGEIHVESEKGVGSVFTVTVTLGVSSHSVQQDRNLALPPNLRAVVVDDDEIACEHAKVVLRAIGIESDAFTDARAALQRIREAHDAGTPYALLLTDYKMPSMNGTDLTRAVRAFAGNETAVIMLTGYNWDIIDDEVRANGVDSIMAKPLFSDSLLRTIHGVLTERAGDAPTAAPAVEADAPVARDLAGRRILMAEDVDQNAEILADLLELEDMESERAENGEVAVRMFGEHPAGYYDAILMDVRMPVMDGLSATRAIRAMEGRPDAKTVPIIAMTANVFDEDVQRSLQAGMNAHLSKPIEPDRLYDTMARLIHPREG